MRSVVQVSPLAAGGEVAMAGSEPAPLATNPAPASKKVSGLNTHLITKIRTHPLHKIQGYYCCDEVLYILLWVAGVTVGLITVVQIIQGTQELRNSSKFGMNLENPFKFPPVEICIDFEKDDFSADGGFVLSGIDHLTPGGLKKSQLKAHKFTARHLADSHNIDQKAFTKEVEGLQWISQGFYDPFSMPKKKLPNIKTAKATLTVTNVCQSCDAATVKGKKTVTETMKASGYTYPEAIVDDNFKLAEWQAKWKYDFEWNITKTVCINLNKDGKFQPKTAEHFMGVSLLMTATDGMSQLKPYVRINGNKDSIYYVANSGLTRVVIKKTQDKFVPFAGHFKKALKVKFTDSYSATTSREKNWVNDHTQHRCENGGTFVGETSTESYLGTTQSLWYMPWKEFFDWYCAFQPWIPTTKYTKNYYTDAAATEAGATNPKFIGLGGETGIPAGSMPQWSCDPSTYNPEVPMKQMAKPYFGAGLLQKLFKVQTADPGWTDKDSLWSMWNIMHPEGKTGLDTVNNMNDYVLIPKKTKGLVTDSSSDPPAAAVAPIAAAVPAAGGKRTLVEAVVPRANCPTCVYGTDATCGQVMSVVFSPQSIYVPQTTITEMPVKMIADIYVAVASFLVGTMIFVNLFFGCKPNFTDGKLEFLIVPRWNGGPYATWRRTCPCFARNNNRNGGGGAAAVISHC